MKPKKIWANMGVADLKRTTDFYTQLGFKYNGQNSDLTSFLFGDDEFIIHFFLTDKLRPAMYGELANLQLGNEILFTLSASSREQVDDWQREVIDAGGSIASPAVAFGEGYYGFVFADPDGHRFNVFYMKGL